VRSSGSDLISPKENPQPRSDQRDGGWSGSATSSCRGSALTSGFVARQTVSPVCAHFEPVLGTTSFHRESSNVRLKAVRRLARTRLGDACLAEGGRAVRAALTAGVRVRQLYVAPELFLGNRDELLMAEAEQGGLR
jgi:hypothetical protein